MEQLPQDERFIYKEYNLNINYIQLCLTHTRAKMRTEEKLQDLASYEL